MKTINQLWKGWMAMCLLCLAACSDQDMDLGTGSGSGQPGERGIWLTFQQPGEEGADGGNAARSTLQSSEVSYKDVKEVYLYVFHGTGANAECIVKSTVNWNENKDENGQITKKVWVTADLKAGETYTFMAVGWDDRAGASYGFPDAIVAQTGNTPGTGTKLGDCLAQLQWKKVNEESDEQYTARCMDAMAHSQLFVGTTTKTVASSAEDVAVTLRRKMAGILVYLRNIPVNVVLDGKKQPVKKLQVCLQQEQNTQLQLWKANKETAVYGKQPLKDSKLLFEVDFEKAGFIEKGEYFAKDYPDSLYQLDDTYLAGAYLLPIEKVAGKATLSIQLLGTYTHSSSGNVTENYPLKTYEVRYKDSESKLHTDFALKENTLYAIGKKLSNSSTSGDKPADLSGNLLELNVLPWDTIQMDNIFPVVTGPAIIEAGFNGEKFIFNASNSTFDITIKPAVDKDPNVKKQWTLNVNYEQGNEEFNEKLNDWIHFKSYNAEGDFVGYTNTLTGNGGMVVTAVINDYAVKRDLNSTNVYTAEEIARFKNDIRRAQLELYTDDVEMPYTLQVQQHNTLTIYSRGNNKGKGAAYRGIDRMDFGCSRDELTGVVTVSDSAKISWGYSFIGNLYVSGDNPMDYVDGEVTSDHCFERMKKGAWGSQYYWGSAIQKLTRRFIQIETVYDENGKEKEIVDKNPADPEKQGEKNWYLPAFYEMWGVSLTFGNQYAAFDRTFEEAYWTSSGDNGWYKDAYIAKIGVPQKDMQRDKDNAYHVMFMVHFEE